MMPMGSIYLSGARSPALDVRVRYANDHADTAYELPPIGILLTPKTSDRPDDFTPDVANIYRYVGLDNGCFTESGRQRFERLGLDGYIALGERAIELWGDEMLFATAPDVPMDWRGTLKASLPVLERLRERLPSRAALVLQDGATPENIPWKQIDWVFIGGSTEWKIGPMARACAAEARRRHKGVHMGRVNSLERMRIAQSFGCDSADGTYLLHEIKKGKAAGEKAVETIFSWARETWSSTRKKTGGDPYEPVSWHRLGSNRGMSAGQVVDVSALYQTDEKIVATLNEVRRGDVSRSSGRPLHLKDLGDGRYYVVDGAHRVVEAILLGTRKLAANVGYDYPVPSALVSFDEVLSSEAAWHFGDPRRWRFGRQNAARGLELATRGQSRGTVRPRRPRLQTSTRRPSG